MNFPRFIKTFSFPRSLRLCAFVLEVFFLPLNYDLVFYFRFRRFGLGLPAS